MSLITDIRAVSENAVEQIAARFAELPRPLLAAIGAGDMAVARLADLGESLSESIGERVPTPSIDITDVRSAASDLGSRVSDLPSLAQKVAAEVAGSIEQFAARAPAKAQEFIAQMPEKVAEVQAAAQSLSPDAIKETVEAYSHLAAMIYSNLADRGDKTWTRVKGSGAYPSAVVETVPAKARPAPPAAAKTPARAATRVAAPKAAPKSAVKPVPAKPATVKPASVKVAAVKPAKRPVATSADKVIPKVAPQRPARKPAVRATVTPVAETVVSTPVTPAG